MQKPGQGQSGIGVGLALARGIVELHGGTIEGQSEGVGKGSVLIVDDKQVVSDGLAMLVRSLGAQAHTEPDGPSALSAVRRFKPDIAILDIGLPGMDGYDLAAEIRKLPGGRNIILAAVSGWGQEEARQRALHAGFDHYFVKPMDVDALEKLLSASPAGRLDQREAPAGE